MAPELGPGQEAASRGQRGARAVGQEGRLLRNCSSEAELGWEQIPQVQREGPHGSTSIRKSHRAVPRETGFPCLNVFRLLGGVRASELSLGLSVRPSLSPTPAFQPQQCQRLPATWRSSSVLTAAASSISTTVMVMMTAGTGLTRPTAVSAPASGGRSWEGGGGQAPRNSWGGKAQVSAGAGAQGRSFWIPWSLSGREGGAGCWGPAFCSAMDSVHGQARYRSLSCFPSLPPALPLWGVHV